MILFAGFHRQGGPLNVKYSATSLLSDYILKAAEEAKVGTTKDLNGEKQMGNNNAACYVITYINCENKLVVNEN